MSTRRKGKIAQLSYALRTRVNEMLRDGKRYTEISDWLASNGAPGISEKNVENWAKPDDSGSCGYTDWLKDQDRLEDIRAKREFAIEVIKANDGATIHEAAMQFMASQLYDVVVDFDLAKLKAQLSENPALYNDIASALAKLSKGGLEYARYRDQVAERKAAIEAEIASAKTGGGLTQDTLERIERELKLL